MIARSHSHTLQTVFDHLVNKNTDATIKIEIIGKNQRVITFNHEIISETFATDIEALRVRDANAFKSGIKEIGLTLNSDLDEPSIHRGRSTSSYYIEVGDLDLVQVLLDHGANPLACDEEGNNAFVLAAKLGRKSILKELLKSAEPDQSSKNPSRVKVNVDDLQKPNKQGETLISILDKAPNQGKAKRASHSKSALSLQAIKELTDKMPETTKIQVHSKQKHQQTPVATSTEDLEKLKSYTAAYKSWASFFSGAFAENNEMIFTTEKGKKLNSPAVNLFLDKQSKINLKNIILPFDRTTISAVVAVLNEYSTFDLLRPMRRYRKDAANLLKPYLENHIKNIDEVISLYKALEREHERITNLMHSGETKNDKFNSEYCRRLEHCLGELAQTEIIRNYSQNNRKFDLEAYNFFMHVTHHTYQPV